MDDDRCGSYSSVPQTSATHAHYKTQVTFPPGLTPIWQSMVNLIATTLHLDSCTVVRIQSPALETLVTNHSEENPINSEAPLDEYTSCFCGKVINDNKLRYIPDMQVIVNNQTGNDSQPAMRSFLGHPMLWPDGKIFGVLCFQDRKANAFTDLHLKTVEEYGKLLDLLLKQAVSGCDVEFKTLIEHSQDAIMRFDKNHRHLYVNPVVEKLVGIKPEGFIGKTHEEIGFPKDLVKLWDSAINKVFESGKSQRVEFCLPDGMWMDWLLIPEFSQDGEVISVITSARDITEIKQAQQALRESENKLRETQRMAKLGYWTWDIKTGAVEWSEEVFRIFEQDPNEFTPQINSIMDLSPWPEENNRHMEIMERALETREQGVYEQKFLRPDGSIGYYMSTFQGFYDEEGTLTKMKGTVQDITARKEAEKALEESEEKYRTFIKNSYDPIIMLKKGRIVDCNPATLKILGYNDLSEIVNLSPSELSPEYQVDGILSSEKEMEIHQYTFSQETNRFEWDYFRKDGEIIPFDVSVTVMPSEGEEAAMAVLRDISERRRADKERQNLEEQLRQSQKMEAIGHLAGGIAHDFNNLLTPILGNSEIALLRMKPTDPYHEEMLAINDAAARSSDLIRQLLAFSRKQILDIKMVDINEIIANFRRILRRTIREDIKFEMAYAELDGLVKVDISQIEQILMNLYVNAQDAMRDGGHITLSTQSVSLDEEFLKTHSDVEPGLYVHISIQDTGEGMAPETMNKIFDPFFTTKPEGQGTGLGLSTTYGIVKQHSGFINVSSILGEGTTFDIYLPLVRNAIIDKNKNNLEMQDYTGAESILVVEDQELVRKVAVTILQSRQFNVHVARNAEEAIALVMDQNIELDLLLTDIVMPGMNGRELYNTLVEGLPNLKVLYMSGYTNDIIANHGIIDRERNFIQKPFSVNGLLKKVKLLLDDSFEENESTSD